MKVLGVKQRFKWWLLATCKNYENYVKINNSVLHKCDHVYAGFFCCDILYNTTQARQGKHNGFCHIVAVA